VLTEQSSASLVGTAIVSYLPFSASTRFRTERKVIAVRSRPRTKAAKKRRLRLKEEQRKKSKGVGVGKPKR